MDIKQFTVLGVLLLYAGVNSGCDGRPDKNDTSLGSIEHLAKGKEQAAAINGIVDHIEKYMQAKGEPPESVHQLITMFGQKLIIDSPVSRKVETIELGKYSLKLTEKTPEEVLYELKTPEGRVENLAAQILKWRSP